VICDSCPSGHGRSTTNSKGMDEKDKIKKENEIKTKTKTR